MIERLRKLQAILGEDLLIIDKPIDLFYLTGLQISKGRLLVSQKEVVLLVDGRYFEIAQKTAPCRVMLIEGKALQRLVSPFFNIRFDSAFTSVDEWRSLQKECLQKEWVAVSDPLQPLRVVKDKQELAALQKAATLTWKGYEHAASLLKEGITEEEVAWGFEEFCRKKGASGMSFSPIVAFGENSAYPHHRAGKTMLKKDQVVLIDVGAVVDHYAGDLTRVVFFGKPNPEIQKMLSLVVHAQKQALLAVKKGMAIGELDKQVRKEFQQHNMEKFFVHGLGHGIGLETHEYPRIKWEGKDSSCLIEEGMVFTLEPGLYLPGIGGVRHEDMIVVTPHGGKSLYPC